MARDLTLNAGVEDKNFKAGMGRIDKSLKRSGTVAKQTGQQLKGIGSSVASAVGTATPELGLLAGGLTALPRIFKTVSGAAKILGKGITGALVTTGIGILIPLIASLVLYFTRTKEGALAVAIAMEVLENVIGLILDYFATLGKVVSLVFQGKFSEAISVVKVFGSEVAKLGENVVKTAKLATELAKLKDALVLDDAVTRSQVSKLDRRIKLNREEIAEQENLLRKGDVKAGERGVLLLKQNIQLAKQRETLILKNVEDARKAVELNEELGNERTTEEQAAALDKLTALRERLNAATDIVTKNTKKLTSFEEELTSEINKKAKALAAALKVEKELAEERKKIAAEAAAQGLAELIPSDEVVVNAEEGYSKLNAAIAAGNQEFERLRKQFVNTANKFAEGIAIGITGTLAKQLGELSFSFKEYFSVIANALSGFGRSLVASNVGRLIAQYGGIAATVLSPVGGIALGAALIATAAAIRAAGSGGAGGAAGGRGTATSSGRTVGTALATTTGTQRIVLQGRLVATGGDLVAVIEATKARQRGSTFGG